MGVQYITQDIYDYMVEMRRWFHCHPELSWQEKNTAKRIVQELEMMHIDCRMVCDTAVLGFLPGQDSTKTIGLRADMDALAVQEETGFSFSSVQEGVMHACGHDGHMAMLLSYAIWASDNLDKLKHNIVCLFQPSEEDNAGANDIIKSNILDKLKVTKIFGFHIWPKLEENKIFSMPRGMLA